MKGVGCRVQGVESHSIAQLERRGRDEMINAWTFLQAR